MKDWFRKVRYKLAYLIAPDWIDDLENRLSGLLCEVTGGRLSKAYYPLDIMVSQANDFNQKCCDECEKNSEGTWKTVYKLTNPYLPFSYVSANIACSVCKYEPDQYSGIYKEYKYCPNCGAKMKGGAE